MSGTTASNSWDEIWAEFDARQARPVLIPAMVVATGRSPARPKAGFRRLGVVILLCLSALYLASPIAMALQLATAIQHGDDEALARHVDWDALRPALAASLSVRARDDEARPMPAFISGMAEDIARRLGEPEALGAMLRTRLAHAGPARELLARVKILEIFLWEIAFEPPGRSERAARVTLALADPMRLRWEVRSIELPPQTRTWRGLLQQ